MEITESVMMEKRSTALTVMRALKDLGATLFMDDFGTGYSLIVHLKSFPVDVLKMDRSMEKGLDEDLENRAVVSATMGLAHALGLRVLAEGVETPGEMDELRSMGCDLAQGYYWQKPCPPERTSDLWAGG